MTAYRNSIGPFPHSVMPLQPQASIDYQQPTPQIIRCALPCMWIYT